MALFGSLIAGLSRIAPAIAKNVPNITGAVSAFVPQNQAVRYAEAQSAANVGQAPPGGLTKTQMLGVGLAAAGVTGYAGYRTYRHYRPKKRSSSRRSYF
jgi:hypothetical protein